MIVAALANGCGARQPAVRHASEAVELAWPPPPEESRIRFVRSVREPGDWGVAKSPFRRFVEVFAGADSTRLVRPTGVAQSGGTLYVADPGANCLWIFDAGRQHALRIAAAAGEALVSPVAVAARADGAVFVADSVLGKVFLFDRDGDLVRSVATGRPWRPAGLAYDRVRDILYVVDPEANLVTAHGPRGEQLRSWGAAEGAPRFNRPTHVAVATDGTLLVTDAMNFRVQAFDPGGAALWKFGRQGDGSGDFAAPKGVAMDSMGHVYVVDALFDAFQVFDRDGALLLAVGERGAAAGQFSLPNGMFIDEHDQIYIADAYNGRIQVFAAIGPSAAEKRK